ncbi:solute carrier family 25 member 46-like protein [Lasius niger]|uniref:Solute carrier family 25 member 46-like protein n=1 Tax=Lasius niger TaxID=67767 RepID=A0A0J7NYE8_LASNI|nr:solute carrier family 25 member 46-like protein [Lasius niger]
MAGLEGYESVYRGRSAKSWEMAAGPYPQKYHGREVIHPLDIPVVHPLAEDNPPVVDDDTVSKYVGLGCGLASLITGNLLIHPFVTQGINTLWKGIGSVLLVRGMTLAVEDLISKITPWPK